MTSIAYEWETVDVKSAGNRQKRENEVYLTSASKGERLNRLNITADLVESLGWNDGERVNLKRSKGGTMFALCKDRVGLISMKRVGNILYHQNFLLIAELMPEQNGTEYDAWIDGEDLIFKPKRAQG